MKRIILGLAILFVGLLIGGNVIAADSPTKCPGGKVVIDEIPFPREAEIPFPWGIVDGSWDSRGYDFQLKVIKTTEDGTRYLSVAIFDNKTSSFVGRGIGVAKAADKRVRARIKGDHINAFMVLRAFVLKNSGLKFSAGPVLVASLREIDQFNRCVETHYPLFSEDELRK